MATMYCGLCRRAVDARRHVGVGTVALTVLTGGLWLLAIPFYARRCSICRTAAVSPSTPDGRLLAGAPDQHHDVERRLGLARERLEAATDEIERLRVERDFYRELLGDRVPKRPPE